MHWNPCCNNNILKSVNGLVVGIADLCAAAAHFYAYPDFIHLHIDFSQLRIITSLTSTSELKNKLC